MARWIAQSRVNCEIKFMICGTIFLHPKERQITIISTELQKIKPTYNKGQDTTTLNWGSNWQIERGEIL